MGMHDDFESSFLHGAGAYSSTRFINYTAAVLLDASVESHCMPCQWRYAYNEVAKWLEIDCCMSHNPFEWGTVFGKGGTTFGCQNWSHKTDFGCQIRSRGTSYGKFLPKLVQGNHFWGDQFWCDSLSSKKVSLIECWDKNGSDGIALWLVMVIYKSAIGLN